MDKIHLGTWPGRKRRFEALAGSQQWRYGKAFPQSCDRSWEIYDQTEARNQADLVGRHV